MKIVVLSSLAYSLINFRGELLAQLKDAGHDVVAVAPDRDATMERALSLLGIRMAVVPMDRTGTNPARDAMTLIGYCRLFRAERPDVVLAYTQKPIIYGGLAARLCGNIRFHALMTGLGYLFSPAADRRPWLRALSCRLYREGVRRAENIFVFNRDDRGDMIDAGIIASGQKVVQVPGSGIDTTRFVQQPMPDGRISFLMIGRLMRDKGLYDYLEAARIIVTRYPHIEFRVLGRPETSNPTGVNAEEIERLGQAYPVQFLPETRDVRPFLGNASVFVLPSYYREGLPRTILEAMATGRPVITTDMPGCRDPIENGGNGILVPARDPDSLAAAMAHLIEHPDVIERMGKRSREMAESIYDVRLVNQQLIGEMGLGTMSDLVVSCAPEAPVNAPRYSWVRPHQAVRQPGPAAVE
ncbi:glycosyltransferase family 4 protein [Novosphingobium lentum]|uniref:glycosyltransferase family 4 protein n=1 Tax=Novosphingobium lentum TaxID=145287 RepID=UPI0008294F58|nr:glycosyltransferase family 4 protein [Novosphingobium lentum]